MTHKLPKDIGLVPCSEAQIGLYCTASQLCMQAFLRAASFFTSFKSLGLAKVTATRETTTKYQFDRQIVNK